MATDNWLVRATKRTRWLWFLVAQLPLAALFAGAAFLFGGRSDAGVFIAEAVGFLLLDATLASAVIWPERFVNLATKDPGDGPKNPFVGMP